MEKKTPQKTVDKTIEIAASEEAYYAPELFAYEMAERIEERRKALHVQKLTKSQIEEIVLEVFKKGTKRPFVKDDAK